MQAELEADARNMLDAVLPQVAVLLREHGSTTQGVADRHWHKAAEYVEQLSAKPDEASS
jgi:division protein CdvB (Snf7/Vps24/ESCRT-III family)